MTAAVVPALPGRTGLWVFLASDLFSFLSLLFIWAFLRAGNEAFRAEGDPSPGSALTAGLTAALVLSSLATWRATRAARPGGWLLLSAVLGALFVAGQGVEWAGLSLDGLELGRSQYASTFFLVTGFHGLHVAVGALLAAGAAVRSAQSDAVRSVALYCQFVDAVWLLILATVYAA
ncbi:MAG: cytochrome c oxidase subunit 3 [Myxococcaceae bacterium]|nr:cytochrome c oxidase subunit 3 [Myxococcaceae bacterium]